MVNEALSRLDLSALRFHLSGDEYSAQMLYLWLNHYVKSLELVFDDKVLAVPLNQLKTVGFEGKDALLPYPKNVYQGYRVIQEYLCYAEGFLFFELEGLRRYITDTQQTGFTLKFCFSKNIPHDVRVNEDSFRLNCTPAINLFKHDIDPIDLNGKSTEYRIRPSGKTPAHYDIFSVDTVQGWAEKGQANQRRVYLPFESFEHEIERAQDRKALYYRLRIKNSINNDG